MSNDSQNGKHHEGDVAFIQSLAELLNSSDLSELSVKREYGEHDRLTVSLSKQSKQVTYAAPAPVAAAPSAAPVPQLPATSEDPASLPGAVTSPMVGTAYLSAEPGSAPFVQIGQAVAEGDTLPPIATVKAAAAEAGLNPTNVSIEYYRCRQFHGVRGRQPKAAQAEA